MESMFITYWKKNKITNVTVLISVITVATELKIHIQLNFTSILHMCYVALQPLHCLESWDRYASMPCGEEEEYLIQEEKRCERLFTR